MFSKVAIGVVLRKHHLTHPARSMRYAYRLLPTDFAEKTTIKDLLHERTNVNNKQFCLGTGDAGVSGGNRGAAYGAAGRDTAYPAAAGAATGIFSS